MNSAAHRSAQLVFHIGYHKTASTWLQTLFATHPEVYLANNTAQPWNDPFLKELIGTHDAEFDASACESHINAAIHSARGRKQNTIVISAERLSGHPISGGIDSAVIGQRIRRIAPDAKIICLIREQVAMIGSVYKQMVVEGYQGSLYQLLSDEHWKIPGFNKAFYRYDSLVKLYCSLFSTEQLLVVPSENIKADRARFLSMLFSFIGVAEFANEPSDRIVNSSLPDAAVGTIRRLNYLRRTELNPRPLIAIPETIHRAIQRLSKTIPNRPKLVDQSLALELKEYYSHSNRELELLLNAKLPY